MTISEYIFPFSDATIHFHYFYILRSQCTLHVSKKKSLQTFGAVICSLAHVTYVHIISQDTNKVLQVVQLFFIGLSNMR